VIAIARHEAFEVGAGLSSVEAKPQMSGGTIRLMRSQSMALWSRLVGLRASFARDAIISFAGGSLARAITLASLPFVTRIYAPADLGIWAIILTLATFVLPLATMRYDVAVVIAPTRRMAAALVLVMGVCSVVVGCALAAAVVFAPASLLESISGLGGDNQKLLSFVPFVLVQLAAQTVLQAWLTREHRFGTLSLVQLTQAIVTAAATLILPFFAGANAVVATTAAMIGLGLAVVVALYACGRDIVALSGRHAGRAARVASVRFKVYPIYFMPYSLSAGIVERVVQVVLASAYSISALGAFYVARQLLMAPAVLLAGSLRQVLFAHSARQTDAALTRTRTQRILTLLIDVLVPGLAFCLFWLKPVLTTLMGESWVKLGDFAWWILFPASMYLLTGWLDRMLDVIGRQRTAVILQLVSDAVLIALAVLSPRIGLDDVGMVATLSVGIAFYNVIWLGITLRLIRFSYEEILALAARACGLCVLWAGMHFAIAALMPGAVGFGAASALLAFSLALPAFKLVSNLRIDGETRT
jgi:O-antigen/teichoic acid export membrane protein